MVELGTLEDIYLYPIKSLPGIKLEKALITKYGIAHPDNHKVIDRKWMIIDQSGSFRTQRQLPKMALVKQAVEGNYLILSAPDRESIKISVDYPTDKKVKCRVWGVDVEGYAYENEIGKWISDFLETPDLSLVAFGFDLIPRKVRQLNEQGNNSRENDEVIYEDFSPFMLIGDGSLKELNQKLEKKVTMRNFRPNFVAKDCPPFSEDNWKSFTIGKSKFTVIKHCTRCLLTTVDPETGVKDPNQQPLKTLKEFRTNKEVYGVSPMFGINIASDNVGHTVSAGDKITYEILVES